MIKTLKRIFKQKPFAFLWLVLMMLCVLFAPYLANQKPFIVVEQANDSKAGVLQSAQKNYRNFFLSDPTCFQSIFFAPIPYSPGITDGDNLGLNSPLDYNYFTDTNGNHEELPWRFRHLLGTDARGSDVLAGLIHGARYSLTIAFFSMLIACALALLAGTLAGYFAREGWLINRFCFWMMVCALLLGWFYGFYVQRLEIYSAFEIGWLGFVKQILISVLVFISILFSFYKLSVYLSKKFELKKRIKFPVDGVVTRITELFTAVPKVILVICLVAISKPSVITLIAVFGLMEWTDLSRMVRAEVMRLRQSGFVEAAIATGLTKTQIILKHIIPNLTPVVLPVFLYGISVVILTESGLAFLGLGVEPGTVTWGNLIAQGKENIQAWWLMLFPGLMILFTVLSLNAVRSISSEPI